MRSIGHLLWSIRAFFRLLLPPALAAGTLAVVALGGLPPFTLSTPPSPWHVAQLVFVAIVLAQATAARVRFVPPSARAQKLSWRVRLEPALADLEAGFALVGATYAAVAVTGGQASPLSVLPYFLVAFAATFQARTAAAVVVIACLTLEAAAQPPLALLAERTLFLVLSAGLHGLFMRGLVRALRGEHDVRVETEIRSMRDEAREFRLIASALGAESRPPRPRHEEERKLAEGAVETIHASMYYTLELLKRSLDLTTSVLLWLDDAGETLKIKELVTDSECVVETAIPADAGALGAIVRDRLRLSLSDPKRGHVAYYAGPEEVGAFLGVPVLEDGHLRGVLCADRTGARPFGEADEALLLKAAEQILRSIQAERVFAAVERGKYEHERFFRASAMLGRALTPEQVMETAIQAAREIVDFELASIALFDKDEKKHRVLRVEVVPGAESIVDGALEGLEFRDNSGLAAMVVKNKHYLPAGGELRDQSTPVFTRKVRLKGVESLLVLPLVCADDAIGTLTLASRKKAAFGKAARDMLGVIANQVAVSLVNARIYRQMETMATTDGLTGLTNHRTFQEKLVELLGRADRLGIGFSLILTDVDHFKKVNDTYGHPVGDQVLKGVAAILAQEARKIDCVARYGGEEFAILMEGTDAEGAQQLAERIREKIQAASFNGGEKGAFNVTISLGIADCPTDSKEKELLVERADQSLYHAKHTGRNRSLTYRQLVADRAKKAG